MWIASLTTQRCWWYGSFFDGKSCPSSFLSANPLCPYVITATSVCLWLLGTDTCRDLNCLSLCCVTPLICREHLQMPMEPSVKFQMTFSNGIHVYKKCIFVRPEIPDHNLHRYLVLLVLQMPYHIRYLLINL